ncbi:MAG TPA: DUF3310 domain-containing protein [Nitrososphaera sp.]|nr:DUF3310 domain-containing protein [Nitrososphaera sp.]
MSDLVQDAPHSAHYKELVIEPLTYIQANKLNFCEGNIIKYVSRWRFKDDLKDLEKARFYLDCLIEEARRGNA